jgi:RND family efflux transporter MFP subunit
MPAMKLKIRRLARSWVTYVVIAAVVVVAALAFGGGDDAGETAAVERRTIASIVDVTGSVVPLSSADLGFEQGGRVASLPAKEGARVWKGQLLAALDSSALYADLKDAQASLAIARAEAGNTEESVDAVEAEQDTLVENAYRTLLSEGLQLVAVDDDETLSPPIISGRYDGPEGRYKLRVFRSPDGFTMFRLFDLEETAQVKVIAADRPTPFGTHGLYITFEGDLDLYRDTDWTLDIPNRSSAEYRENQDAYEAARRERDRAVQEAREELERGSAETSIAAARVAQAEASVARVQAQIGERAIVAPFSGLVKTVDVELGEIAAANAAAITLISDGSFEVEADLPEIDSTRVRAGMDAKVTVDALGEGKSELSGKVGSVDRAESLDGSVPVYKMKVYLDEAPAELRSGMTASVVVEVASKDATLSVPLAAVELAADGDFVSVVRGKDVARTPVSLGLRGDDGYVEVSGEISEGDRVVLPQR